MENIETLLAAVAQTQGFDDDESVASTGSAPRLGNFGSSPEIRGDVGGSQRGGAPRVVPGDIGPYVVVRQPPLDQMTGTSIRRKRGRPPKVQPSAKPPPPKRRKEQKEGQLPAKPSPPKPREEQEKEGQLPAMPPPPKRIEEQGKEGQLPVKPLPPKRREEQEEGQLPGKPRPPKRRKEQAPNEEEEEDYCFICLDGGSLVLCDRKGCPKVYHPSCVKRDEAFFTSKYKWTCGWHICSVCRKASYYMCYTCPYSLCKGCSKDADFLHVRGNKGFCNTCMKIIMLIENKDQASNDSSVQVDFDDTTSWEYLFKTYWVILKEKLSLTMDELTRVIKSWRGVAPVDYKPQISNVWHTAVDGKTTIPNRSSEHLETTNLQELHNDRLTTAQSADAENGPMINRDSKNETTNGPVINADPGSNKLAIEKAVDILSINDTADPGTIEKPRADPAEMPNLDSRLLGEDDSQNNSLATAGVVGSIESSMEVDGNNFDHLMGIKSRKQEKCKHEEREIQNNLNKYAAVDVHNMNLIYLRRNLMENLIDDKNFQDKVVGSIVRIRISSDDQKPDVYRLVQVVRICKVAKLYKIGDKMVDVMLEVLNLGKKEVVSVDAISNQEFTEAECRQLDQYVRCGLLKQYIFDEVQKKAMALQSVRFNDAEVLRLYQLLDQASKKGCEDEVSEYVRKIQLLKSPDECQHRISEVPEIHEDVETAPIHISEDVMSGGNNTKGMSTMRREDIHASLRRSGSPLNGEDPVSPNEKGNEGLIHAQSRKMENIDARGLHGLEQHIAQVDVSNSAMGGRNNQEMVRSELETSSAAVSIAIPIPEDNIETEKLWHYRDSNGKIQGPFSMMHLRLLSTTRQFPPEMRIWTNHEQYDSLLLTDALNGKLHGASELPNNLSSKAMDGNNTDGKQTHGDSGGSTGATEASWTKCWDLFKDKSPSANEINHVAKSTEMNSSGAAQFVTAHHSLPSQSSEEKLIPLPIGLSLNDIEPGYDPEPVSRLPESSKQEVDIDLSNLPSSRLWGSPSTEKHQSESSNVHVQTSGFLELLSPKPRSDNEDEESRAADTKQYGPISPPVLNSGPSWSQLNMMKFPDNEPIHPGVMGGNVVASDNNQFAHVSSPHPASSVPSWMATIHEPIEFVALGEDSVSDLLAEVDAMESRRTLSSPTSAAKFIKELFEDSKDDCFSSIEDFIPTSDPVKSDALSSTGEIQLSRELSVPCKPVERSLIDALNSYSNSGVHSSGSSTGETSAPVYSGEAGSEFHGAPPSTGQVMVAAPNMGTMALGPETSDLGWGSVQGNINLVTVQGNVNLVLGGPAQGMANLGWGVNQGTTWGNPSMNHSPKSGSLLWDSQRKYSGERFGGGREWGYQGGETGFGRGRLPWGRLPYGGGGGYSRPLPKGQRVCKFYESGHCKKGAFCDYLHP